MSSSVVSGPPTTILALFRGYGISVTVRATERGDEAAWTVSLARPTGRVSIAIPNRGETGTEAVLRAALLRVDEGRFPTFAAFTAALGQSPRRGYVSRRRQWKNWRAFLTPERHEAARSLLALP